MFLIGHGYSPVITVRDGNGDIVYSGPTPFLPLDQTFQSIGVVKASTAEPTQIGLEGEFYPTVAFDEQSGTYFSAFGNLADPMISMLVYTGDLNMGSGVSQSVYSLDKSDTTMLREANGAPYRIDLRPGEEVELPDGLGTVTFDGRRALEQAPDQPDARQADRARGRRDGADRAARVAVHPAATGLGSRPP